MAALTIKNPADRPAPATYSHAIEVAGAERTLYLAGQVGIDAEGRVADGIEAQTACAFANIEAILKTAGMTPAHIVKATFYLTDRADREAYARVRAAVWGDLKPASTLLFVSGLFDPAMRIEIDIVAVA